jgi:hypothetical protein
VPPPFTLIATARDLAPTFEIPPRASGQTWVTALRAHQGGLSFLVEFSEVCRRDLADRATAIG